MLEVYTANTDYIDPDELDVTVKTGNPTFAPTWDMVRMYKDGELSKALYTSIYEDLMVKSYWDNPEEWKALLAKDRVVLKCYCRPYTFCHRTLLGNILQRMGATFKGEI